MKTESFFGAYGYPEWTDWPVPDDYNDYSELSTDEYEYSESNFDPLDKSESIRLWVLITVAVVLFTILFLTG